MTIASKTIAGRRIASRIIAQRRIATGASPSQIEPFNFSVGTYTFTAPRSGYWKFVLWGTGAFPVSTGGASAAYAEITKFLPLGATASIFVSQFTGTPAATTVTFADGSVASAGDGSLATPGVATGGDINLAGTAGTAGGGTHTGNAGSGTGGGPGGAPTGGNDGGAGAPGNLPYLGGRGAGASGAPGQGGGGCGGAGGNGLVLAVFIRA